MSITRSVVIARPHAMVRRAWSSPRFAAAVGGTAGSRRFVHRWLGLAASWPASGHTMVDMEPITDGVTVARITVQPTTFMERAAEATGLLGLRIDRQLQQVRQVLEESTDPVSRPSEAGT